MKRNNKVTTPSQKVIYNVYFPKQFYLPKNQTLSKFEYLLLIGYKYKHAFKKDSAPKDIYLVLDVCEPNNNLIEKLLKMFLVNYPILQIGTIKRF